MGDDSSWMVIVVIILETVCRCLQLVMLLCGKKGAVLKASALYFGTVGHPGHAKCTEEWLSNCLSRSSPGFWIAIIIILYIICSVLRSALVKWFVGSMKIEFFIICEEWMIYRMRILHICEAIENSQHLFSISMSKGRKVVYSAKVHWSGWCDLQVATECLWWTAMEDSCSCDDPCALDILRWIMQ